MKTCPNCEVPTMREYCSPECRLAHFERTTKRKAWLLKLALWGMWGAVVGFLMNRIGIVAAVQKWIHGI